MEVGMQKSLKLSTILKEKGVDLIDVSSGALVPYQQIPVAPNYQVPFAEQIKKRKESNRAVGLITEAHQAEEIISSGSRFGFVCESL
jgi:2,4-dienoyl-CoA reductase-like NADH-dependent reductase (Old Yellow Enzyme family)